MVSTRDAFYELAPHLIDVGVDEEAERGFAGRRFIFMDTNVWAKIIDNMEDVAGPVIQRRVKEFGREAGGNIGEKMSEEFESVSRTQIVSLLFKSNFRVSALRAIRPNDNKSQLQKIMGYAKFVGWYGDSELIGYEEGEYVKFKAENTFESHSYGTTGQKVCSFLSGAIVGIVEHFWETEVEVEEIQCSSEDEYTDHCLFEVEKVES